MQALFSLYLLIPTLSLLSAIGIFSTSLYLPSFPAIGKALGATQESVQFTLTMFFLGSSLGHLLLGPVSDRIGRLLIVKSGLLLFIAASFWCAEAQTILSLQIGRFFQGMGASVGPLIARSVGRDLFSGRNLTRFSATIMMITSSSPAIAPTLGGIIDYYLGWENDFYFLMLLGLVIMGMVWLWLPETLPYGRKNSPFFLFFKDYALLIKSKYYSILCFVIIIQMTSVFFYVSLSPYLFITVFGWSPQEYGCVGLSSALGNIAGFAFAHSMANRLHFHQGILIGSTSCFLLSVIFVGLCLLFQESAYLLILYNFCFYSSSALALANAAAAAMNLFPNIAGTSAAIVGTAQILAGAFGCSLASILPNSPLYLGIALGSLTLLSVTAGAIIERKSMGEIEA